MTVELSGKLEVASQPAAVTQAQRRILDAVREAGYPPKAQFAIRLALDEAACNAMRHGNAGNPHRKVTLQWSITDDVASISVSDQGPGFNPDALPDPTADENLVRPCGRGVMLIRQYMTAVRYSDGGRTVTLIKRRDCDRPAGLDPD